MFKHFNPSFILLVTSINLLGTSIIIPVSSSEADEKREVYVPPDIDELTKDAKKWYFRGVDNANRDLEKFEPIVNGLKEGTNVNELIKAELETVLMDMSDANDNTISLVPKLKYLVDCVYTWTRNPSWWEKAKLKALIYVVNGRRDNKSYYLQNGAGLWFKLRLDKYLSTIQDIQKGKDLYDDFDRLGQDVLLARDVLDDAAQQYVRNLNELVPLVDDIGKNEVRIREIADEMKVQFDTSAQPILDASQASVDNVQREIDLL